jgi:hypothetical protein
VPLKAAKMVSVSPPSNGRFNLLSLNVVLQFCMAAANCVAHK